MKHILVVDDHEPGSRLVRRMLEMSGFEVHSCTTGEEARDYLHKYSETVGLVVTDWKMPGINGLDICQMASHLNIPTILLTAHTQNDDSRIALSLGATDYLIKPVTRSTLTHAVQKYFD